MVPARFALCQPGAVRFPPSCRQNLGGRINRARRTSDVSLSRRLCTGGFLAGVCGFVLSQADRRFQPRVPFRLQPQAPLRSVNAERVYELETTLQQGGFTEKQARALILAAAALRRLEHKVTFDDVGKVFNTAWQVEDDMAEAGFSNFQARQLGLMSVSLASTKQKKPFQSDEYWDFWEVADASHAGKCLELAGGKPYDGFRLATAMLNFARREWDT